MLHCFLTHSLFNHQVKDHIARGDMVRAENTSQETKKLSNIALGIGIVGIVVSAVLCGVLFALGVFSAVNY